MPHSVRPLKDKDTRSIVEIFNYYVEHSFAAYPEKKFDKSIVHRMRELAKGYPFNVVEDENKNVIGFGFLHPYSTPSTFRKTAEITYFLHKDHLRKGVGTLLLDSLLEGARKMGVTRIVASISSKNEQSLNFHKKHGFVEAGRLMKIGQKFGEEFDVVWMQRDV